MKGAKLKKCKNCEIVFKFFRINVSRFSVRSNRIKAVKPLTHPQLGGSVKWVMKQSGKNEYVIWWTFCETRSQSFVNLTRGPNPALVDEIMDRLGSSPSAPMSERQQLALIKKLEKQEQLKLQEQAAANNDSPGKKRAILAEIILYWFSLWMSLSQTNNPQESETVPISPCLYLILAHKSCAFQVFVGPS